MSIELLPHSRWNELERAFKESRSDEQLPKPASSVMLAARDGDELIGAIGAERVWLISPCWIKKERRGAGLVEELVAHLKTYNTEDLREVCATTNSHVERFIYSIGFKPIEGQLWRR